MATPNVHTLIPRTFEYIILHGNRNTADMDMVTDLEMGRYE